MNTKETIRTAHEIAFEIFYSRATNGQAPSSIERGAKLIEDYASQFKQSESQQTGGLRWAKGRFNSKYHSNTIACEIVGVYKDGRLIIQAYDAYGKPWENQLTIESNGFIPDEPAILEEKEDSSPVVGVDELCGRFLCWVTDNNYVIDRDKRKFIAAWDNYSEHTAMDVYRIFVKQNPQYFTAPSNDLPDTGKEESPECFIPCLGNDPLCCGFYKSNDGQSLCHVKLLKTNQ
jgi:hypothetical protein